MKRKISIVGRNMALGVAGGFMHMRAFIQDIKKQFSPERDYVFGDLNDFICKYADDEHGKIVLNHIHALFILRTPEKFYFYVAGTNPKEGCYEQDTRCFGKVVAIGSGADALMQETDRLGNYNLQLTGAPKEQEKLEAAMTMNLSLISQLHKLDSITSRSLLEYWGGSYDIVYWCNSNGFKHLEEYTIVFWVYDLEKLDNPLGIHGVLKFERKEDFSLIYVFERGDFSIFGISDLEDSQPHEITISQDDIDFNSPRFVNLALVVQGDRVKNIYNFTNNYSIDDYGIVFIDFDEKKHLRININSEISAKFFEMIKRKEI